MLSLTGYRSLSAGQERHSCQIVQVARVARITHEIVSNFWYRVPEPPIPTCDQVPEGHLTIDLIQLRRYVSDYYYYYYYCCDLLTYYLPVVT